MNALVVSSRRNVLLTNEEAECDHDENGLLVDDRAVGKPGEPSGRHPEREQHPCNSVQIDNADVARVEFLELER